MLIKYLYMPSIVYEAIIALAASILRREMSHIFRHVRFLKNANTSWMWYMRFNTCALEFIRRSMQMNIDSLYPSILNVDFITKFEFCNIGNRHRGTLRDAFFSVDEIFESTGTGLHMSM